MNILQDLAASIGVETYADRVLKLTRTHGTDERNRAVKKTTEKLNIEKAKFDKFMARFKKKKFGNQRLGQAFFNEFDLHRVGSEEMRKRIAEQHIYESDGDHALRSIREIVTFT